MRSYNAGISQTDVHSHWIGEQPAADSCVKNCHTCSALAHDGVEQVKGGKDFCPLEGSTYEDKESFSPPSGRNTLEYRGPIPLGQTGSSDMYRLRSQSARVQVPGFSISVVWQWNMYFSVCLIGTFIITNLIE